MMEKQSEKEVLYHRLLAQKERCKNLKEYTLEYYVDCLLKLYKEFDKVERTDLLFYLNEMIDSAVSLVIKHFLHRLDEYFNTEGVSEKARILKDIKISVEDFNEVWETLILSSNVADHMLIQSAPIEPNIRTVPIKLCAYYARLLNDMAELYQNNQDEGKGYAFFVYPSLGIRPEARLLFMGLRKRGKVGIVRIPEKDMEDVSYVRLLILHEFFHILPGSVLRSRRERAVFMAKILLYDICAQLLAGVDLGKEIERKDIEKYLFEGVITEIEEKFRNKGPEDRCFYSTEISETYTDCFIKCVKQLLGRDVKGLRKELIPDERLDSFEKYMESMDWTQDTYNTISNNILDIMARRTIYKNCLFYMEIFREVFADLLSIWCLRSGPEDYFASFRYRPQVKGDFYRKPDLYLRVCLVLQIMSEEEASGYLDEDLLKKWRSWRVVQLGRMDQTKLEDQSDLVVSFVNEALTFLGYILGQRKAGDEPPALEGPEADRRIYTLPNKNIWNNYMAYFRVCRNKYREFEHDHADKIEELRSRYSLTPDRSNAELLMEISQRIWEQRSGERADSKAPMGMY